MHKTVPQRLALLGNLYEGRNAVYGDDFRRYGRVMLALFPDGITIKTESDLSRFGVLTQVMGKLGRYAAQFDRGGHPDSLDDLSVYAQILRLLDDEANTQHPIPFPGDDLSQFPVRPDPDLRPMAVPPPPPSSALKCVACQGYGICAGEVCEDCSGTGTQQHAISGEQHDDISDPDTVSGLNRDCPECGVSQWQLHKSHCSVPKQLEREGQ